ncbi:GerAB/ArcD/ProY family transporter [Bacillus sp. V3-13]|uniref:GerAB/ArcD/ProY family transporter n=1 Tax=Bacillus sp. V3-13 TaxID=2053728 RepID=UPI002152F5DB|nr:GerAB/ArcD/ProY family transporter [Bacillus sp. V3-13]
MSTLLYSDRTATFGTNWILPVVNRLQMLYFVLILPSNLVNSYMIWVIAAIGVLAQLNLVILSRWLASDVAAKGFQGFVQLFGERKIRVFAFIGLFLILLKIIVLTIGYVEIVQQFIFPSVKKNWLIFIIFLTGCYVASKGMEKTIRFGIVVFICTFWLIFAYIPFFFEPNTALHNLYPLIPTDSPIKPLQGILMVWSCLSGPEFLVCLVPWLTPGQKVLKYLTAANMITIVEYLLLFIASSLFFGTNYLGHAEFPVVNLFRYLQWPVFERMDVILIAVHIFYFVFAISLFLLCCYGAVRIMIGRTDQPTTRKGFISCCIMILIAVLTINTWFWESQNGLNIWQTLQVLLGAFTFLLIPTFLLVATKVKGSRA